MKVFGEFTIFKWRYLLHTSKSEGFNHVERKMLKMGQGDALPRCDMNSFVYGCTVTAAKSSQVPFRLYQLPRINWGRGCSGLGICIFYHSFFWDYT